MSKIETYRIKTTLWEIIYPSIYAWEEVYRSQDSIINRELSVPKIVPNYFSELQTSNKQAELVLSISHTTQRRQRWKKRGRMTDRADCSDSAEGRSYCPEIVLYLDGKCAPKIAGFRGPNFSFLSVWLRENKVGTSSEGFDEKFRHASL